MNSILEIQEKKDSERKLQQVENVPKEYVLFANEINIIVKTAKCQCLKVKRYSYE